MEQAHLSQCLAGRDYDCRTGPGVLRYLIFGDLLFILFYLIYKKHDSTIRRLCDNMTGRVLMMVGTEVCLCSQQGPVQYKYQIKII